MSDTLWIMLAGDADTGAPLPWARVDGAGQVIARGLDTPARLATELATELPADLSCKAVVAAERVLWLRQPMPGGRPLRGAALAYALEDRLVDEPEAVHAVAGRSAADGTAMVAVVERAWLYAALAALGERRPACLLPEPALLPATPQVWRLVWGARPFLVTGQGAVRLDANEAAALDLIRLALSQTRPDRLELLCETGRPPLDAERWARALGIEVVRGPDYDWAATAQRAVDTRQPAIEVDLARGDLDRAPRHAVDRRAWRPAIRLAIALAAINATGVLAEQGWQAWQARQLREANRAVFMAAFPDSKVVVDPLLQMRRKLEELRHRAGEPATTDFLPMLARAGAALPAASRAQAREIRYENGHLVLLLPADGLDGVAWSSAGLRAGRRTAASPGMVEIDLEVQP